ncbi:DNA polymerase III subunit gamma/tau [Marinobacter persicus]|uniref:DNA polymerase III subunit gamma/tau n=1 Tax=Marinobacter persicus TaxID=930118 RepID=A0A2S6G9D6_9GAMM|nr:DNA polymerase III subunit gamma/tau [Marinobacter persicus]KXS53714.1 MAG: DNA polymerase III subunit tau and gamma [Marinobacter sp. T13-3]PPK52709.1 DNA polymerase-3 subunit gamma/tau [Marinobacter persicus]PPK55745.1 DNA polymerase-3 subunit gamma/tau [Marinobacter persicus]PPK59220.1 DNA polymerase-3 subunit gamma/tau [Marinobacter persicus]
MSYQVLARKWRPRTFEDMVGQEHVLQALVHALEHERLHHAYLFTGTRGVGKTTIGRLLARCLNCETGITPNPCGECDSCREILDGRFVDLIEIDAASRTGVDDMRELTDNVQYSPTRGRYKVYLIDEVHMLTNQSFNAFLKTLEEPPEHVKFLLATTDPQKLPVTVLSRCLQFNLKRMTPEHIVGHLRHVLGEEQIPFEEPALWLLARAADGSMRDALSLTDQAIAFGDEKLSASDVSNMLGTIDQRDIERIVNALVERDGPGLLTEIGRIAEFAPDYGVILSDMLSLFHRVTMEQVVPGSADNAMGDAAQVQALARKLSAEDAQLFYQTALIGRKDLAVTPDARMGFEMTLLRMLAFRPGADRREPPAIGAGNSDRGSHSEDPEPGPAPQPAAEAPALDTPPPAPEPAHQLPVAPVPEEYPEPPPFEPDSRPVEPEPQLEAEPELPAAPEPEAQETAVAETSVEHAVAPESEPAPARVEAEAPVTGDFVWERDFRQLGINGMPGNLASNSAMAMDGNAVVLTLDEGHARLLNARHEEKILAALRSRFGDTTTLKIEQGNPGSHTPAAYEERQRAARQQAAEQAIAQDPLVKRIVEQFEGRVVTESIRPADSGRR